MTPRRYALAAAFLIAVAAPAAPPDTTHFTGVWLFDAATQRDRDSLSYAWTSKLTVTGDAFALAKFLDEPKDLTGKFAFDPADPKAIDLNLDEFDVTGFGSPVKIPAGKRPGVYRLDGDRLTVCFATSPGAARPASLDATGDGVVRLTLVRAPAGFKEFPAEVTVRVTTPGGSPAAGVTVAGFMHRSVVPDAESGKSDPEWRYTEPVKTGADGTAKVKYEGLRFHPLVARDPGAKRMAVAAVSPASLARGEVTVALEPECRALGTITCEEVTKGGQPLGWTNAYLMRDGRRVASCSSTDGKFEFVVPPGKYTLNAYGSELKGKTVAVEVPTDRSEFTIEPIALKASKFLSMVGKPAPELDGVVGWKGTPVKLADLKGKYVLLEFWGYWCGPCVASMPVLMELHEKFADKGLAVVGVHLDGDGDVDTAAKLDEMIANHRKTLWKGKDLPFPSALVSGRKVGEGDEATRGAAAAQYGVLGYPTTILIDRAGTVVRKFHARDAKSACEEVEKLLKDGK